MSDAELLILLFILFIFLEKTITLIIFLCIVYFFLKNKNENFKLLTKKLSKKLTKE